MIRMIVFDLDGTLFDMAEARRRHVDDLVRRIPRDFPPGTAGADLDDEDPGAPWRDGDRFAFARSLKARFPGLRPSASQLAGDFAARLPGLLGPDPAVLGMLAGLGSRYTLAILTNGSSRVQRAKLAAIGVLGLVDRVSISGEIGVRKPDATAYRRPLEEAGCRPEEAVMVGDRICDDVMGSRAVGMAACWVSGGRRWPDPTGVMARPQWTIDRVLDLPGLLP